MNTKKQHLYIMIGIPGSGKSTYAKNTFPNAKYVSRDEIRFSLLKDGDEYFSKENEVFRIFTNQIIEGLAAGRDVVADATHLNVKSRAKLFSNLAFNKNNIRVIAIYMKTPLAICLSRNEQRLGTKTYVPKDVIIDMQKHFKKPSFEECNEIFDEIRSIQYNGGEKE